MAQFAIDWMIRSDHNVEPKRFKEAGLGGDGIVPKDGIWASKVGLAFLAACDTFSQMIEMAGIAWADPGRSVGSGIADTYSLWRVLT